jgi:hypothetical protein
MAVTMSWAPRAQALAALVEKQCGRVVGAGPVGALVKPAREGFVQLRVDRDVARWPLQRIRRTPLRAERAMCRRRARDLMNATTTRPRIASVPLMRSWRIVP